MKTEQIKEFSDKRVRSYKAKSDRYDVRETAGLRLRVHPTGVKAWVYIYSYGEGKGRRTRVMTLGSYPDVSLADAHIEFANARKSRRQGIDPAAEQQVERSRRRKEEYEAGTVAELIHEYIERYCKKKHRDSTLKEDVRILKGSANKARKKYKSVLDIWGNRKAKDITRRDVVQLLDDIDKRSAVAADNTKARLTKMFKFGVRRAIIDSSPCVELENYSIKTEKIRNLDMEEIKQFWNNINNAETHEVIKLALKLLLVTGQRRGELALAYRSEFDLDNCTWLIPAEHTKNGLPQLVPLSPLAIEVIVEMFNIGGESKYLLPNRYKEDDKPMRADALSKAIRNNRDIFNIDDFSPHDLRRTLTTQMTGTLKIPENIVEKVLNHQPDKKRSIVHYNHYEYFDEKKSALLAWSCLIQSILDGETKDKVVSLVQR